MDRAGLYAYIESYFQRRDLALAEEVEQGRRHGDYTDPSDADLDDAERRLIIRDLIGSDSPVLALERGLALLEKHLRAKADFHARWVARDIVAAAGRAAWIWPVSMCRDLDAFEIFDARAEAALEALFHPSPIVVIEVRP